MSKLIAKNVFQLPKMNLLVLTTSAFLLALDVILYKIAIGPAYFQLSFGFCLWLVLVIYMVPFGVVSWR